MESSRKQRWQQLQSLFEPGFRRMLLVSLLLHLLLPILYHTPWFPKKEPVKPPVYRVNLVNKIVEKPQAGRPEAVVSKEQPKPKAKPKPKPKPVPVKPKPQAKPVPKPVTKPVAKPEPKPKVSKSQDAARLDAMAALQAKIDKQQAEEDRQKQLDALRAAVAQENQQIESPVVDAPAGMLDGKGDEIGVSAIAFIRELIQSNWKYSPYLSAVSNPAAKIKLFYSADGELQKYDFIEKSGVPAFDDSLTKAVIRSKSLGQPLPETTTITVTFNLKELLDQR